jgi:hypothetical protein
MGTKNNPGKFDCYDNADPDEPIFIMCSTDPLAPHLVRMWAKARRGDIYGGLDDFRELFNTSMNEWKDGDKESEADDCADAMANWREIQS